MRRKAQYGSGDWAHVHVCVEPQRGGGDLLLRDISNFSSQRPATKGRIEIEIVTTIRILASCSRYTYKKEQLDRYPRTLLRHLCLKPLTRRFNQLTKTTHDPQTSYDRPSKPRPRLSISSLVSDRHLYLNNLKHKTIIKMDFAIQDKEGNLSLPNGTTVNGTSNGASTPSTNGNANSQSASIPLPVRSDPSTTQRSSHTGTFGVKSGLAQMLKGGVIMDVMNVEQAKVAEEAGAVAVMALERIPSLIRSQGGIARMVSSGS